MNVREHLRPVVRAALGDRGRGFVRRLELRSGLRPRVNHRAAHSLGFPEGKRAAVVITADFELAWAWRYIPGRDRLDVARRKAANGRRNVGVLLDLFDTYALPCTWATVGHLMLASCGRNGGPTHPELPRVPYFTNLRWTYRSGDWFDGDPGLLAGDANDPEWLAWYAPDLLQEIMSRQARHEIGCHTFSHIPFDEAVCRPEVAVAELQMCQAAARQWGLELRSFVFPGNMPGNHSSLLEAGFTNYRSGPGWWELDVPRRDARGLWAVPAGLCLDPAYNSWTAEEHFGAMKHYIDVATQLGLVCGLWFHPEMEPHEVDSIFPRLLAYLAAHQSELWVTTSGELVDWLSESQPRGSGRAEPREPARR